MELGVQTTDDGTPTRYQVSEKGEHVSVHYPVGLGVLVVVQDELQVVKPYLEPSFKLLSTPKGKHTRQAGSQENAEYGIQTTSTRKDE